MTLNSIMAVTLRYFTEFGKPTLQKMMWQNLCKSLLYFLVGVQCRHKESSRSLSHLLMSFLLSLEWEYDHDSVLINITVNYIINVSCNPL